MKEFMELALVRQSCRSFADKPVEKDKIVRCLEAARVAPSACNSQPWRFVAVTAPEKAAAISKLVQLFGGNKYAEQATAFIVACEELDAKVFPAVKEHYGSQAFAQIDLGATMSYLTLQAAELGLGTCILGVFDKAGVRELLGLRDDEEPRLVLAMGYPAKDEVREKSRKPLDEVVRFAD